MDHQHKLVGDGAESRLFGTATDQKSIVSFKLVGGGTPTKGVKNGPSA
jgi:hypothetical protein